MITKEGIYTHGIFGFINMMDKIRKDYDPEYMAVAFDVKAPTFRHKEFEEYKAAENLQNIKALGGYGRYGFYESIDKAMGKCTKRALELKK